MTISGKRVLMVIPQENFRDEEFDGVYRILRQLGAEVSVCSSTMAEAIGLQGKKLKPNEEISSVNPKAFDAIVFIGGPGVRQYFSDRHVMDIAQQAFLRGKIVSAISFAPSILANAGILEKRNATSSLTEQGNLIAKGAIYTGREVEVSGNVITAKDPKCAIAFAEAIARELYNQ